MAPKDGLLGECLREQQRGTDDNQVAGVVYRNICSECGLDPPKSRWETPTSELSVQKSAVLGTAKVLRRTLKLPGLC